MERRTFFRNSLLAGAAMAFSGAAPPRVSVRPVRKEKPFNMKFSPEFDIFDEVAGKNVADQIRWGYDQGFRAWESSFLTRRPVQEQELISKTVQQLGMEFGQFVGTPNFGAITFAGKDESLRKKVLDDVRASVEVAKRMNTKIVHNVLGISDPMIPWDMQMANAIDLLKRIADIYEPHGITMVMETINRTDNPYRLFLHTMPQAYALAKTVGRPNIKLLFDFYHVQVQEGNLLKTLDMVWDEVAYLQMGNPPGRFGPTEGEINFSYVLQHVHDKGYRGFVGLEHGTSKPGKESEWITLKGYRTVDPK